MSAVATKKIGGDYATQLTFPAVFEEQAKRIGLTSQFYPEQRGAPVVLLKGSGIQEDYHEQKRLDANRRALNGVKDTAASTARFLSSHANYIIPKPVLGQRVFANPSNGNQADIYSNRPVFRLSGGVLRTKEGQEYGLRKLKERIPQLDAIQAAKDAFLAGMPVPPMGVGEFAISDITTKVELYGLLTLVESDVEQGVVNTETVNRSQTALKLLFSFIPVAEVSEVEETMAKVEVIQRALGGIEENYEDGQGESDAGRAMKKNVNYLKALYDRMRDYLVRMNGVLARPRKEKEKVSNVFIKSLGFAELEKMLPKLTAAEKKAVAEADARNPNADPDPMPLMDEMDRRRFLDPVFEQSDSVSSFAPSLFARLPLDDEEEAEFSRANINQARLSDDERQRLADLSGEYVDAPSSSANAAAQMSEEDRAAPMPSFADVSRGKQEALDEVVDLTVPVSRGSRIAMSSSEQAELVKLRESAQADQEALERQKEIQSNFDPRIRFMNARSLDNANIAATKAQLQSAGLFTFSKATGDAFKKYLRRKDILGPRIAILEDIEKLERKIQRREQLEAKANREPIPRPRRGPEIGDVSASASSSQDVEEPQFFTGLSSGSGKKGKGKVKRDENFFMNLLKNMRMNSVEY